MPASSPTRAAASALEPPQLPLGEWIEPSLGGLRRRGFSGLDVARGLACAFACPADLLRCFRLRGILQGDELRDIVQLLLFLQMAHGGFDHWWGPCEDGGFRERHWIALALSFLFGRVPHWEVPSFGDRAVRRRLSG